MTQPGPRIAYLTAGGAGMFCGSCMRDNTLAAALVRLGCDVQLIPMYTPIRTDEENVAIDEVFLGGINVYLQQKLPPLRYLPDALLRWLDRPRLIRWATRRGIETDARLLGELTVSMLRGQRGRQWKEIRRLASWLADTARPQLVNLSNMLIAGCVPEIKRRLDVPVLVTLQGDDVFLDELPPPYLDRAMTEIRRLVPLVDGFVVFSRYYADFMAAYLDIPAEKIHLVPMGLNSHGFSPNGELPQDRPPTIGYLARICPPKGLHVLVDAFLRLRVMEGTNQARLHVAGWLGRGDRAYFDRQVERITAAGLADDFHYAGVIDRREKIDFLHGLDVLSVPTIYREPKGIFVLEALAAGVPVVQPEHGAFPELLAATGGGRLVRPEDPRHLAETLHALLTDPAARAQLAEEGRRRVTGTLTADHMAAATLDVYRMFIGVPNP